MNTTGHNVLVTGGSTGIGLAIAAAFLEQGSRVAICARNASALTDAAAVYPALRTWPCDLRQEEDLRRLVVRAKEEFGGLSVLVNNAGIQLNYDFTREAPEAILERIDDEVDTNLTGLAKLTALFIPVLKQAHDAAIVNVSSGLALVPKRSAPIYCATKAAVHSFSKSLRWQMEDSGLPIRVFEVLPPMVETAMTEGRGKGKIAPEQVAAALLAGMRKNQSEIRVGKVRMLAPVSRFFPRLAERILRDA
ncbi:MAG: short-chain dehydrogenase [Anaerolinea sp.]|nr:short-chain dehydrogenase [Anaerolinea sp.]